MDTQKRSIGRVDVVELDVDFCSDDGVMVIHEHELVKSERLVTGGSDVRVVEAVGAEDVRCCSS